MGSVIAFFVGMALGVPLTFVILVLLLEPRPKKPPTKDEWKLM